ncbi:MAG: coenzyme F420-0:L-glutamate ligase [Chloroflexi bacterium]|nr:coenzyme F420-0:L-glutamate ligase [Chloroflexota bacterium]
MPLTLTTLRNMPEIHPGDNLVKLILEAMDTDRVTVEDGDILVLAQKIVSKAEGRLVNLVDIEAGDRAKQIAQVVQKDARLVELILRESREVLRMRPGTIIVEHRNGFVCANAGIDHSNVRGEGKDPHLWYLLLPEDADQSAREVRSEVRRLAGVDVGAMIIDSHGRAWRNGTVGITIGLAGVPGIVDMRGMQDMYGYRLQNTLIAAADELAGAASLMMGQADEKSPVVVVKGFPYPLKESSSLKELIRPKDQDLFR